MGYRSDVVIAIGAKTEEELENLYAVWRMTDAFEDARGVHSGFDKEVNAYETYHHDDFIVRLYEFNDVKWYPNYKDVKAYDWLLLHIGNIEDENIGAFSLRLGEDHDDVEIEDFGENGISEELRYNIYPVRSIKINLQKTKKPEKEND